MFAHRHNFGIFLTFFCRHVSYSMKFSVSLGAWDKLRHFDFGIPCAFNIRLLTFVTLGYHKNLYQNRNIERHKFSSDVFAFAYLKTSCLNPGKTTKGHKNRDLYSESFVIIQIAK